MIQLHEQHRPTSWADLIGQDKIAAKVDLLRKRGLAGRAYWISGSSGTGKTCVARLLANEVAEPYNVDEFDAGELTPSRLRDIERRSASRGLGDKTGLAYVVNESHALRRDTIARLLVTLERLHSHCLWAFTTTNSGEAELFEDCHDAAPLLSRCIKLELTRRDLTRAFALRVKHIAEAENLDGRPVAQYERLLKDCRNNMRMAIQRVESGEMRLG